MSPTRADYRRRSVWNRRYLVVVGPKQSGVRSQRLSLVPVDALFQGIINEEGPWPVNRLDGSLYLLAEVLSLFRLGGMLGNPPKVVCMVYAWKEQKALLRWYSLVIATSKGQEYFPMVQLYS